MLPLLQPIGICKFLAIYHHEKERAKTSPTREDTVKELEDPIIHTTPTPFLHIRR